MRPSFNTAGPCYPDEHYMLPPERRLGEVLDLIEERRYFTLHAGRQTGKSTSAQWLVEHLNAGDQYRAVRVDIQNARDIPEPRRAFEAILDALDTSVQRDLSHLGVPADELRAVEPTTTFLLRYLRDLAARSALPLVVIVDNADALMGESMASFLTQLRQGYIDRKAVPFPSSVMLAAQRQVRDYALRDAARSEAASPGTSVMLNIAAEADTLAPFTEADVGELLAQHTAATGQHFTSEAIARIHELGQGHPWVTNALSDQIVRRDVRDRSAPITAAHVDTAKETILREGRSHIDLLVSRMLEPRVRRFLDAMMQGKSALVGAFDPDFLDLLDFGALQVRAGKLGIANPMYREALSQALHRGS